MKRVDYELKVVDGKIEVYKDGIHQFTASNQEEAIKEIIKRGE